MKPKKEVQHVYLVGAKSMGTYGGYKTFVYKLTEYHQNKENIKYHVACNGDGCMDESKFEGVTKIGNHEFELHNAHCFKIDVPQIGAAQVIYYDVAALKACCEHIKKNQISHPIVYIMACRVGLFVGHYYKEIHKLGGTVYLNPDGGAVIIGTSNGGRILISTWAAGAMQETRREGNVATRKTSNKLKIGMLGHKHVPSCGEGGVEVVVEELSIRMSALGYQVTCYNQKSHHVSGKEYDGKQQSSYKGVRLKTVPTIERKGLAAVTSSFFASLFAAVGKYDVVHIHAEGPAAFCWIPKLFEKRVTVTIHGWKDIIWLNQKTPHKYSVLTA